MITRFWKRIAAFVIDYALLSVFVLLVGFGLERQWYASWSLEKEYLALLLYFSILNTGWGGGTIGKRLCKLKVVDSHGQTITFSKSFLRAAILFSPVLLLLFFRADYSFSGSLFLALAFTVGGSLVYFYVVNSASRQSLHDLATGTFVVQGKILNPLPPGSLSKRHLLFPLILMLVSILFFCFVIPEVL